MAGNILSMTLQMRNHAVAVANNLKNQLVQTGNAAQGFGTKLGKAVKASHTSLGGLMGSLINLKALIIAAFVYKGIQAFARWLGRLSEEANKGKEALIRLQQGLASFGNYTKSAETTLVNLSNKLQQQIGIADDVSQSLMGLLGTYNMTGAQIERLTPLIIDFAKAKGIELKTAFDLVGKANMGYTGTLSRYGIIIDSTLSKEEKMVELEKLMGQYRGTAAALAGTYAGKVSILSANYADLKERAGETLQVSAAQSGVLEMLNGIVKDSIQWWDKWGVVVADKLTGGLKGVLGLVQKITDAVMSSPVVWVFAELASIIKVVYYAGKSLFTLIKAGLAQASNLVTLVIAKFGQLKAAIFGSDEDKKNAKLVAEEVANNYWAEVERINSEMNEEQNDNAAKLAENAKWAGKLWTSEGFAEWKTAMDARRQVLQQQADAEKAANERAVVNGEKKNEVLSRTIQLTKTMAQQFAMATRLEQEQTKYMMKKLRNMDPSDVGNLSEQEKKLINNQGVLKEAYEGVFSEYAEKQLGIKGENKELKAKLTISLTDEAAKLLKVSGESDKEYRNVQYELKAG
jgi:hypothetical protein